MGKSIIFIICLLLIIISNVAQKPQQQVIISQKTTSSFTPLALRFDGNSSNALRISSGTFDYNSVYTCMAYVRMVTDTNANATIFVVSNQDASPDADFLQTGADGTALYVSGCINGACSNSSTFTLVIDTWYHVAIVRSGVADLALWINGNLISTSTQNITGRSAQTDINIGRTHCCGGFTGEAWNGRIAADKCWNSAFNEAQIEAEMNNYDAITTSNLWGEWYLLSNGTDSSGNGRNFTVIGTLNVEAGPPISQ